MILKKYDPTIRKKDGKWIFDFQKLSRHNNGNKCILVGIDVLSKRLFCSPTKSKGYKDMKVAFDSLLGQMPMLPHRIYSDRIYNARENKGRESNTGQRLFQGKRDPKI